MRETSESKTMTEQFALTLESAKSFDTVVANLQEKTAQHKFRVLGIHDVQATLAEKGFQRGRLKIIEICNAEFAHEALDKDSSVAVFMPCRYTVQDEGDKTVVRLARPTIISQMLPEAGLEQLAAGVEATLIKIMQESV